MINQPEEKNRMKNSDVIIKVRFLGILQKYSDGKREVDLNVPPDPGSAVDKIFKDFNLPWENDLEKITRIFVNDQHLSAFIKKGELLSNGDIIAFIQLSGGG